MADPKKYLDYEGLEKVWGKVKSNFNTTNGNVTTLSNNVDSIYKNDGVNAESGVLVTKVSGAITTAEGYTDTKIGTIPGSVGTTETSTVISYVDAKVAAAEATAGSSTTYSTTTTVAAGGISKGTTIDNKSIKDVLDMLLSPYVAPSTPSLSATYSSGSASMEVGQTATIDKVTVSWTNGSKKITKVEVFKGSESLGANTLTDSATSSVVDIENVVVEGSAVTLTATITDENGSKSNSASFGTWSYPYYAGVCDVTAANLTAETIQANKKTLGNPSSYTYTTNDQYPFIAVTKKLTKVTDASGVTDYTNAFGTPTEISLSSADPVWGPKTYYVYTGAKGTLSSFQFKFNY